MNSKIIFFLRLIFISCFIFFYSSQTVAEDCQFETCSMTEQSFNNVIARLKKLYPTLRYQTRWSDDSIIAAARGKTILLSGGFARKEGLNLGGFITVACHEVGHALLGLSEGEADYFASSDCMKKYFDFDDNQSIVASYDRPPYGVIESCQNTYSSGEELARCIRIAVSTINAANLGRKRCISRMADFKKMVEQSSRSFIAIDNFYYRCLRTDVALTSTRVRREELLLLIDRVAAVLEDNIVYQVDDTRVVRRTYRSHNSPACRMQTLRHGNLGLSEPACWHR